MSNKTLIYACGVTMQPKRLQDVIDFAKDHCKFRICNVELNAHLANVKPGDIVVTGKGHSLYVIKAFDQDIDGLCAEDRNYVDDLTRNYDLKKSGISSVSSIIKYGDWCKFAKPLVSDNKNKNEMNNSIKGFGSRIKDMFLPKKAEDVRIAMDGNICVSTAEGYVAIDGNNALTSYPEELVLDLPVYTISKPKAQLKVGDVMAFERSYAKVTRIDENGKINAISYSGAGKTVHLIKDYLLNTTMVRVVVSMVGTLDGGINPMMLLALNEDKNDSLLPLMMMSQQGGALGTNPMLMYALASKDGGGDSMKDLLLMSALSGNNTFGNLFAAPAVAAVEKKADE